MGSIYEHPSEVNREHEKSMMWKLGQHILAQGDAMDQELVNKVVGDQKIRCVLTDPPYGISYVENKDWLGLRGQESEHFKKHKKIENDSLQACDILSETACKQTASDHETSRTAPQVIIK